jgi:hypothetical protein
MAFVTMIIWILSVSPLINAIKDNVLALAVPIPKFLVMMVSPVLLIRVIPLLVVLIPLLMHNVLPLIIVLPLAVILYMEWLERVVFRPQRIVMIIIPVQVILVLMVNVKILILTYVTILSVVQMISVNPIP